MSGIVANKVEETTQEPSNTANSPKYIKPMHDANLQGYFDGEISVLTNKRQPGPKINSRYRENKNNKDLMVKTKPSETIKETTLLIPEQSPLIPPTVGDKSPF